MMTSVLNKKYFFTTIFFIIGFVLWLTYPRTYSFTGPIFGTYYNIILVGNKLSVNYNKVDQQIKTSLTQLNNIFSTYIKDSELMALNNYDVNKPFTISNKLSQLLHVSKDMYSLLNGAWDPTIVPISYNYGFKTVQTNINQDLVVGFNYLKFIDTNKVVKDANIMIDLSSIAKGFAVDELMAFILDNIKIKGAFIDIGGEIKVVGLNAQNKPWGIGIQSPSDLNTLSDVIYSSNIAIATSGNYLNYNYINNAKVGHIFDARQNSSYEGSIMSVSVIAKSCAIADAIATGLFAMGLDDATTWLSTNNDFPVLIISLDNKDSITKSSFNGFDRLRNPE
jgi:thiamine biosynthesis lipoprotein